MHNVINGINVSAFEQFANGVKEDPARAKAKFKVNTQWQGQTRTVSTVESYELCGVSRDRSFKIEADEPIELLGNNTAPNPQELLMAALNACLSVAYVAIASTMGVKVHLLNIETTGQLNLLGFLGQDDTVNPGYDQVEYTVHIHADGTDEQMEEIHQAVIRTSPNYSNFAKPIRMISNFIHTHAS